MPLSTNPKVLRRVATMPCLLLQSSTACSHHELPTTSNVATMNLSTTPKVQRPVATMHLSSAPKVLRSVTIMNLSTSPTVLSRKSIYIDLEIVGNQIT